MDPLKRAQEDAATAWSADDHRAAQTHALIAIATELRAIREQLTPTRLERTA